MKSISQIFSASSPRKTCVISYYFYSDKSTAARQRGVAWRAQRYLTRTLKLNSKEGLPPPVPAMIPLGFRRMHLTVVS